MNWHLKADEESNTQAIINRCGWCVKYPDETYLGCAHGLFKAPNPFYAYNFKVREDAEDFLLEAFNENKEYYADGKVVIGYEHYIADLEAQVRRYQEFTKKTPEEVLEILVEEIMEDE